MHKIIVFDLDGTLAPVGAGTSPENVEKLLTLERCGYKIAICSGKPVAYLCGFARNLGLKEPILIGENGAAAQYGIALPPKRYWHHPYSKKASEQLETIRRLVESAAPECSWYQPNDVCITPFPKKADVFDIIQKIIDENGDSLSELTVYRHWDCFDFVPSNISKKSGLQILAGEEGMTASDFIAIGDGVNDVPMFEYADISIIIGDGVKFDGALKFDDIDKALDHIIENRL